MAYWINDVGNNNRPNLKEFYCDLEEDVSKLPTNTKKVYWKVQQTNHKFQNVQSVQHVL